jgi:hypothetical protein
MTNSTGSEVGASTPSSERDSTTFRLVVCGDVDDVEDLGKILVEASGLHPDDAMQAARAVPGILPMRFSWTACNALAGQLGQRGIRTICLPEAEVPRLEHAETIHHARCQPEGLELLDIHGGLRRLVRWSDLSLLSGGQVPLADGHRYSAEPQVIVHAAPNPQLGPTTTARSEGIILWVGCERPRAFYRLIHNQLNYEYLGTRKMASATQNFSLFLEDLARMAPQVFLTPATRALLTHGSARDFEFHSADELQNDTAFHVVMLREIAPAAEAPSTGTTARMP